LHLVGFLLTLNYDARNHEFKTEIYITFFVKNTAKVKYSRLYQHFIEYNFFVSKHEYGFRSNSSTEAATYKLLNEISETLNRRKITDGILCDLKKAFD